MALSNEEFTLTTRRNVSSQNKKPIVTLTPEIIQLIITYANEDLKQLAAFCLVCKQWQEATMQPSHWKKHLTTDFFKTHQKSNLTSLTHFLREKFNKDELGSVYYIVSLPMPIFKELINTSLQGNIQQSLKPHPNHQYLIAFQDFAEARDLANWIANLPKYIKMYRPLPAMTYPIMYDSASFTSPYIYKITTIHELEACTDPQTIHGQQHTFNNAFFIAPKEIFAIEEIYYRNKPVSNLCQSWENMKLLREDPRNLIDIIEDEPEKGSTCIVS